MKSAHETFLDVEPVSKEISEKKCIVILCEVKNPRKKKVFGLLPDHEIRRLSHIEPTRVV